MGTSCSVLKPENPGLINCPTETLTPAEKDVKFILIKSKRDISVIAEVIQNMPDITDQQKNELISKIISFEEIGEGFG